jgi:hypothetical protein
MAFSWFYDFSPVIKNASRLSKEKLSFILPFFHLYGLVKADLYLKKLQATCHEDLIH